MLKSALAMASPAGGRARLSVLIFHRVLHVPDVLFPGEVDGLAFDRLCGWLRDWFQVLPLDEAVTRLREGTLPARAAAITFDDGYADNLTVAAPILARHGLPATLFVATGFLDGGCMWNDRLIESVRMTRHSVLDFGRCGLDQLGEMQLQSGAQRRMAIDRLIGAIKYLLPEERLRVADQVAEVAGVTARPKLMLSTDQLRRWRHAGFQVGAHTINHPILRVLPHDEVRRELVGSRDRLQDLLQQPIDLFAYPNGQPDVDYDDTVVRAVAAAGFTAAFTTAWGACTRADDRFQLPRFTPWDRGRMRFALRLGQNLFRRGQRALAPP